MRTLATRGIRGGAAAWLACVSLTTLAFSQPAAEPAATPTTESAPTPASPSKGSAGPLCAAGRVSGPGAGTVNKGAPPPPPPTAAQFKAFEALKREADQYSAGAKDFRRTLTTIVRHHYEERRRRVLSALDKELSVEKESLGTARGEAIRRLEEFVAQYSGTNADPSATPDGMFRLASLYEERARANFDSDLTTGLEPAIALYRRIIEQYPQYEEIAAVHYYLGHALTDASRLDEGQQAWRSLVCANKYKVLPDPDDAGKIQLQPLPQDHDDEFWNEWYNKNPLPLDKAGGGKGGGHGVREEELTFIDPYADCEPLPQDTLPGEEPRYLAEIWWQLGNFHFDQIDPRGGPYNLNRAVSAYDHSLVFERPPLYGVAMYKQAWTYFKQQRYHTAVDWFVKLLHYADEQEAKTGDPGADFRAEAFTYISGSLTYVDFEGPPPDDPYIPRNDVLDVETDPLVAEEKMAIAIDRVQDPQLIPQDKKWTAEIYKGLAQEFIEITQNRNAIRMLELTLEKFPMDRDAPVIQNKIAELYDQLARLSPEGSPARAEHNASALKARTKLAQYVGTTPWTDANKNDPEALDQAEQLVRGGLKRAAADHTNYARSLYQRATELSDPDEQTRLLEKAIEEYQLAETGWQAYLEQDPTSMDSYASRFWLADARYWVVVLQVPLGRVPRPDEVERAWTAAVDVRDSNEDDKYLQPAAYYAVNITEKVLEAKYREYEKTNGASGLEKRDEVRFDGEGPDRKVVKDPVPTEILSAVCARDEYNARIPEERDPDKNGILYAFQNADWYFLYGHFDEARQRFTPIYEEHCGKDKWGYQAWEKLISMSNFEGNAAESRRLAEGKSCAFDADSKAQEEAIRKPVKQGVAYLDARQLYEEAEKMPDGPERDKKWRAAAAAYKVALDAAPDRDEAPEAAMNGAFAYKQVGEYDKAIEMYELFISRYGDERTLEKLKNGDPKASPPVPPNKEKYEERVQFLKQAYDALAGAYVLFFDYPKAAETYDKISSIQHFKQDDRREAAHQALSLYASIGDSAGMSRSRARFGQLGASPKDLAEADFIIASSDLKRWDERSPNTGANAAARRSAEQAMEGYYTRNVKNPAAAQYVVRSAYHVAKMKKSARSGDANRWFERTITAWAAWKAAAPKEGGKNTALGSREASMAAEAEYTMIDEDLVKKYDYDSGFHRYKGTVTEVVKDYQDDAVEAKKWYDKLQHVVDEYVSPDWAPVAIARQGSVYDSLRTGLYNTRPPQLKMFSAAQERALTKAEESDNPDLQEKADAIRVTVQQAWRKKRDQELDSADRIVVDRYASSVLLAKRYNVSNPSVTRAIRRLAFLTDVIGEAKMKTFTDGVKDLNYTPGMFQRMRPGVVSAPKPDGLPAPLPAMVQ